MESPETVPMTKIGYAAMLEQFHPTDLLDYCAAAEDAGFSAGFMVSEHFHPWTPQQGQSAFAWSFMGALGTRTSLPFGTGVACPGFRYHPAVIAHAAATLGVECRKDAEMLDETRDAYKPIEDVMAAQSELVEVVEELTQVGGVCVKG